MNETEIQVTLAKLETTLQALTQAFTTRIDTLEEKMDLKLQNIIERMDSQKADHDKDMTRVTEMNDQAVQDIKTEVQDLNKRLKTLEDAPARIALDNQNQFKNSLRDFVFKAISVGLVGLILLVASSVLLRGHELTPGATELIKKATGGE